MPDPATCEPPPEHRGEWEPCCYCQDGLVAGCFEDTCCGDGCDPDDAEYCCAPSRCDVCRGKGGRYVGPAIPPQEGEVG